MNSALALEQFPTPEDWRAIQGGKPLIFGPADSATEGVYYVVHNYGFGETGRPALNQAGLVVPTPYEQMQASLDEPTGLSIFHGRLPRNILVPAVLVAKFHGLACEQRSKDAGRSGGYDRLRNPGDLGAFWQQKEYRLGVTATGRQVLRQK
jgi:hypothetical protein